METKLFNAEDARKLAKEVKEINKQKAVEEANKPVGYLLKDIKRAIEEGKDYIIRSLKSFNELTNIEIIGKLKDLGFDIEYITERTERFPGADLPAVLIRWDEKIYIKTGKDEKVISDLIKSFKLDKLYFEHKPIYWFQDEFPKHFFL